MTDGKLRCTVTLVAIAAAGFLVCARASGEEGSPYHQQLWQWLQHNSYKHWSDVPAGDGNFRPADSPHGKFVKTYVNRTAASQPEEPADGSVLVVENYSQDHRLISINVMQRAAGFDPRHGDWYYATFLPDGRVAKALGKTGEIAFAGKVTSCIDCHRNAWDDDFVFFND